MGCFGVVGGYSKWVVLEWLGGYPNWGCFVLQWLGVTRNVFFFFFFVVGLPEMGCFGVVGGYPKWVVLEWLGICSLLVEGQRGNQLHLQTTSPIHELGGR